MIETTERIVTAIPAELEASWRDLVRQAAEPNAFAEPWFVAPSLAHLRDDEVRLVEIRKAGRLVGLVTLRVERRYGRIPAAHVQNWQHNYQFLGSPLIAAGEETSVWRAVLLHLDEAAWAPNFLHIQNLVDEGPLLRGLLCAVRGLGRTCDIVHRHARAALCSDLSPRAYYETTVRKKKRKELSRLRNRLAEFGPLTTRTFGAGDDLAAWTDAFLRIEASGWKGREGTALACHPAAHSFFREAVAGADAAGRLQFLALELASRPIAMLVNFLSPPGSFSFKTAFDEDYARFSPGVLLQLDNLAILERPDIDWMDSCAAEQHPMIDSLWAERRTLVRVTIPLRGVRRRLVHATARGLEDLSARTHRHRTARIIVSGESP